MTFLPYLTHILAFISAFHVLHVYGDHFRAVRHRFCLIYAAYVFNVMTMCLNILFFHNYTQACLRRDWEIPLQWVLYHGFNGVLLFMVHLIIAFEMQKKTGVRFWIG